MHIKHLLFSLLVAFCYAEKVRYDNFKVYRITPKSSKAVDLLKSLEELVQVYDFWTEIRGVGHPVDIMVAPHLKHRFNDSLSSAEFDVEEYISNVQDLVDNEQPKEQPKDTRISWSRYNTLDEIYEWLRELARTDERVTLVQAGISYENRPILGVRVRFRPGNFNRTVFIESNIHAREWISSAVSTYILNELLYSKDLAVRQVAEAHDWIVVPVFNPDGFVYTHTTDRFWRKTRQPYSGGCYGADPNRNWAYHFNEGGTSSSPCSETYRGSGAFSEVETLTTAQFISTVGPDLRAYIAFHSYSQYLLLPYGYSNARLDNYYDLARVGQLAVSSIARRYGTRYEAGNIVDLLYVASGGSMDWVKGNFRTPITYTYELRDTGRYGFALPANQIIPSGEETLDSLLTILQEFDRIL